MGGEEQCPQGTVNVNSFGIHRVVLLEADEELFQFSNSPYHVHHEHYKYDATHFLDAIIADYSPSFDIFTSRTVLRKRALVAASF